MSRKYGNAQTIGSNVNQNTYFIIKQENGGLLAVVADGTIDSVNGAYGAILACETVVKGFVWEENPAKQLDECFKRAAEILRERLYKGKQARVSLLAVCFLGSRMVYRRAGDLTAAVYDGKELEFLKEESGICEAGRGKILIASRGLWQALNEVEVQRTLSVHAHPYKLAQQLIEEVNRKNLREQMCTAAVIVDY